MALEVDYTLPIEGYLQAGRYEQVPTLWKERIPSKLFGDGKMVRAIMLMQCRVPAPTEENPDAVTGGTTDVICATLRQAGLRPAGSHELLAIGADDPMLQRRFPIVALNAIWDEPLKGGPFALALTFDFKIRKVDFVWPHYIANFEWDPKRVFAALPLE
ncbi:MAG: hypothetical protein V1885_00570 [Candidatus Brennerbacteria bacterium]